MKVLITGADGFLGRNLGLHLSERPGVEVLTYTRSDDADPGALRGRLRQADFVFHLAGVNRPQDPAEFESGNAGLTRVLCDELAVVAQQQGRKVPVVFSSSTQAERDNAYGLSKRSAETALRQLQEAHSVPVHLFRLPNVFGKWSRPNYNSAVATFCHNIARGLPIRIDKADAALTLVYVDDVVRTFLDVFDGGHAALDGNGFAQVAPVYTTTVGDLAAQIEGFMASRQSLVTPRAGIGLTRALYATFVSYLPTQEFGYSVPQHVDPRGMFVEMLKTPDCGQFSFFTAHPGVTRGGHYHHSKTEKFLVIKGEALFRFRHMLSGETHQLTTRGGESTIVETVPGWTHDITNIGSDEMVVMLWANEIFDRQRPDTIACKV
ncbi:MAG: hypothetical protein RIQ60_3342 [Pseudomonadota bacterium]